MSLTDHVVVRLLGSPLHRILGGSTDAIRYVGRASGRTFTTPTQFASLDDGIVIMVGRHGSKRWWRNFVGGHDLEVLLHRRWVPMRGIARVGAQEPARTDELLRVYLTRFPRVARTLPVDPVERVRSAVLVECHPAG